jgi:hypothetical protein
MTLLSNRRGSLIVVPAAAEIAGAASSGLADLTRASTLNDKPLASEEACCRRTDGVSAG